MKRRYPSEVMEYRKVIMNETGIELSPAEAEERWNMLKQAKAVAKQGGNGYVGECMVCGKKGFLRYGCCSYDCFVKRVSQDPSSFGKGE